MSRGGTTRLVPGDPAYSKIVAKNRAWNDYHRAVAELGPDHPGTVALWGRVRFHEGWTPQRGRLDVAAVAWSRESGAAPGLDNRGERRHRGAP